MTGPDTQTGIFPKGRLLGGDQGGGSRRWWESDVLAWIDDQP